MSPPEKTRPVDKSNPRLPEEFFSLPESPENRRPRFALLNRRAILFSLTVNILIIIVLGVWYFRLGEPKNSGNVQQEVSQPEKKADPEPELKALPGEKAQQTVQRVLEEKTQTAEQRTIEENHQELSVQTDKLNQLSDEESIDQLTRQFQKWLNTPKRQTQPSNDPPVTAATVTADNFDADSAQFHDVLRSPTESGRYAYQSVLIDAQGRTLLLDMTESEGKQMFDTMQKIRENPLLDKVYRQIIMPIIDKELKKNSIRKTE